MHIIRHADFKPMPWKNGGGATLEIAVQGEPYDWRLSLATIHQDGAFSAFPGYRRHTLLVSGAGFDLHFDSGPGRGMTLPFAQPGDGQIYPGGSPCHCRLRAGPCTDLNLIIREHFVADLTSSRLAGQPLAVGEPGAALCVMPLTSPLVVATAAGDWPLGVLDAGFLPAGAKATLTPAPGAVDGLVAMVSLPGLPAALGSVSA